MEKKFKSGFVALIGRPNVGKSTLMNQVVGKKVAITSDKNQTTRNRIQGIYTDDDAQIIFIDTPGIHKPQHRLGSFMVDLAEGTLDEADLILFMVSAIEEIGPGDRFIINKLKKANKPVFLLINKVDLINKEDIFLVIESYFAEHDFAEILPLSSLKGVNVEKLITLLKQYLPEGPKYYEEDQITDHPEHFMYSEIIREKVLELTREEVPHSVAVKIDEIAVRKNGTRYIRATIFTERTSQKVILIGRNGKMLKEVGRRARLDLKKLIGANVFLDLWVKVEKDWRNNELKLNQFGFRYDDY